MEALKKIAIIFAIAIGIYYSVFGLLYIVGYRWYYFPTGSMEPTIEKDSHVVGRLSTSYRNHIQRFEIAIFIPKEAPKEVYAKRVIGLPGEHVTVADDSVAINGVKLELPSAVNRTGLGMKKCDLTVPADAIFVLGDNTTRSFDSRYTGPVQIQSVIGYIVFKK